ncbi:DUF397 domain-containing protein [Streptomyces sp. FH025]|uniref:DUF397 domain-containing protein n=1 Tax=Streptomyces sp. FH025 TaxID=2815937 RepID=UPI001A9CE852|nr:DUF397 domain-containing protein [Streptomyces sp. FH025]MBO1419772.1 DUF397 domain-containing protein [Streptomyces sp. FH025]
MPRPDLSRASWSKSSHSGNGGSCAEVSASFPGVVPVRDSTDPEGAVRAFPAEAWKSFATATAAGEFGAI